MESGKSKRKNIELEGNRNNNRRVSELSKYLVEGVSRNFNTGNSGKGRDEGDMGESRGREGRGRDGGCDVDSVYADITQYIVNRVEELKSKLMTNRMSKAV